MPGIQLTIEGNARAMQVSDACTPDSTECVGTWHALLTSFSVPDEDSFEHTPRFHETEELPELEDEIDLEQ